MSSFIRANFTFIGSFGAVPPDVKLMIEVMQLVTFS